MKLTLGRYRVLLGLQFSLLVADLFFNTFAHLLLPQKLQLTILLFVTQDLFIICEYLFFTFAVHATCVYEVGATHVILKNCKLFLFTILLYFLLSVSQHFWFVYNVLWYPMTNWSTTMKALSFVQRTVSFFYYYTYKRTALTISDPRYYEENIDWIAEQLSDK
ncbi:transmembrane protein 138 [Stomoxys calcitrans]|uniref:Transmembrane protein 138 n=1 Tax=Stomoxys calcitrans TaxID=35570 RepID=A0A1I8Q001_STOCA|nr:transmembrane protein 138 [Stomoxys calcitrans]